MALRHCRSEIYSTCQIHFKSLCLINPCLDIRTQFEIWCEVARNAMQPKAWADFLAPLPEVEQEDPLAAYHRRLTSPDAAVRKVAVIGKQADSSKTFKHHSLQPAT